MSIYFEEEIKENTILDGAKQMLIAARTAPKGRGIDNLVGAIITGNDIIKLSEKLLEIGKRDDFDIFIRDAANILNAKAILILGTIIKSRGIKKCGMCGFKNCDEKDKHPKHPCVFNTGDLGIAVGSAVSTAADLRIDCRVMFTIGQGVKKMGFLGDEVAIAYGIPLSATSKNPFFDRK